MNTYQRVDTFAYGCLWLFVMTIPCENMLALEELGPLSRLFGAGALLVGIGVVLATRSVRSLQHEPFIPLGMFIAWGVLSLIWTVSPSLTLARILTTIEMAGFVWLIWQYSETPPRILGLMTAYIVGGIVACAGTLYSFASGYMAAYGRFTAEGFDPNDLALVLSLGIPPAAWLMALRGSWAIRILAMLYIPVASLAIILTGSRMGLGTMAIGLIFAGISLLRLSRVLAMGLAACVVLAAVAAVTIVPGLIWDRLMTTASEVGSGTLSDRTVLWGYAVQLFNDHWILGVGAGAFVTAVARFTSHPLFAHNTFLSILAEQGSVGFICFFAFLMTLAYRLWITSGAYARVFWATWFLVWLVGVNMLTWEMRKPTWVVMGLALSWGYRTVFPVVSQAPRLDLVLVGEAE